MWSESHIGGRCEAARLPANFVGGVFHTIITSFNPQKVLLLNEVFCRLFFQSFASEASGTGAAAAGGWMFALEVDEGTVG